MRTILMATALTVAFASYGQAAPAKSEYCNMANTQRNTPSWNEHYGCLKAPGRQAMAEPTKVKITGKSQYCGMANGQRNTPSWNEYYGCLH
jgi:hypothetical protein